MKLNGKSAVVTGGGRGIGRAICLAFADQGADVVVAADVEAEIVAVSEEIQKQGGTALPVKVDVTDPLAVAGLVDQTLERFGKVDIMVNNAGVVGKRFFIFQSDDEVWRRTIEVNLFGTYNCTKAFLPAIMERGQGRIINIASISGKQASPTNSAYAASKHAVIGLTRTVAKEMGLLGLPGITVNAICPGVVDTDMLTGPGMILDELAALLGTTRESVLETTIKPMAIQNRVMNAEEIADMAVYLASEAGRGITGQAINVCGGSVFY
jgi:NAD(P)-dependent dehydrogenase (short-subunit alcohol dehydrogenase family)